MKDIDRYTALESCGSEEGSPFSQNANYPLPSKSAYLNPYRVPQPLTLGNLRSSFSRVRGWANGQRGETLHLELTQIHTPNRHYTM